jgi:hypothetical protein
MSWHYWRKGNTVSKREVIKRVWLDQWDKIELRDVAIEDIRRATRHKRYRHWHPVAVDFISKNNYTAAVIEMVHALKGPVKGAGFAKRRPTDKYDALVGQRIAMKRAIEDAVNV